jgi:glycogen debranching enzyme
MDPNRNHFPEGYGIMEVLGLNAELIDVSVYTQQALAATARVAALLGHAAAAERYRNQAADLEARINQRFWSAEDTSYTDFYGTRAQALSAADGAIKQIRLKETNGDSLTQCEQERSATTSD